MKCEGDFCFFGHRSVWNRRAALMPYFLNSLPILLCSFFLATTYGEELGTATVIMDQAPIQMGTKVIAEAKKGEELVVSEVNGEWYRVIPSQGWIHAKFIQFHKAATAKKGFSVFSESEFSGQFKIRLLKEAILADNIPLPAARSELESLNNLLKGRSLHLQPKLCNICPPEAVDLSKRESTLELEERIKLNRLILEAAYPLECPKTARESHVKAASALAQSVMNTGKVGSSEFVVLDFIRDDRPKYALLNAIRADGIAIPKATTELKSLNSLLRGSELSKLRTRVSLPKEADDLVAREANLTEEERVTLNRLTLEAVYFKQCPKKKTREDIEKRKAGGLNLYDELTDESKKPDPMDETTQIMAKAYFKERYSDYINCKLSGASKIECAEHILRDLISSYSQSTKEYSKLIDLAARVNLPKLVWLHDKYKVGPPYAIMQIYDETGGAFEKLALYKGQLPEREAVGGESFRVNIVEDLDGVTNTIGNARLAEIAELRVKKPNNLTDAEKVQLDDRLVAKMFEYYLKSELLTLRQGKEFEVWQRRNLYQMVYLWHYTKEQPQFRDSLLRGYEIAIRGTALTLQDKTELREFFATKNKGLSKYEILCRACFEEMRYGKIDEKMEEVRQSQAAFKKPLK